MNIEVDVNQRDDVAVLAVRGEVDMWTAPRLRQHLMSLIGEGREQVIIDLEAVDFLDSTALGVMVGAHKRLAERGGGLSLVCSQRRILRVLEVTGLRRIFAVHDSVGAALGSP